MKIAIIGGESTGKSTLAKALAEARKLTVLDPVKPELLKKSGYHTLFEWAAATKGWVTLVETQLEREQAATGIIDDGVLQLFCTVQRWGWNTISPDRVEGLRTRVVAAAATYDAVILTPPALVGGPAPGRFRNAAHNLQLGRLLSAFASELALGPKLLALPQGAAASHVERAGAHLETVKKTNA
jgi:hypothetical protein